MYEEYGDGGQQRPKRIIMPSLPWFKIIIAAAILLVVFGFRFLISLKLDWSWFNALGYSSVFWRSFFAKLKLGGGIFAAAFLLNMLNLYFVHRLAGKPLRLLVAIPLTLFTAAVVAGNASDLWLTILRSFYADPFGIVDPQFQLDVGFYVFKLPFFWLLYRLANTWLVVNLLTAVVFYLLYLPKGIEISAQGLSTRVLSEMDKKGMVHVGLLLGLLIAWQAVQYKLLTYQLLYSQTGSVIGAGAADVGAMLPAYYIMMVVALLAGLYIALMFQRNIKRSLFSIVAYFVIMIIVTGVFPSLYQKFIVVPDELSRETPYLERNIQFTRQAYGLNNLTEVEYPVGEMTVQDLAENRDIIDNIRLLDPATTQNTYAQQQEIRLYYDFMDVDVDRYMINGELTQVLLAARELNQASLPEQAQTFNNQMFKYTHGFGMVMSPANTIDAAGLPDYLVKDIPPQSKTFQVSEPRIYFGEATANNVIVNTGLKEFDYPIGDNNQEYLYQGKNGIPMTFLNKVLLTIRDMQIKYLLTSYITPESQYLETRNIKDRVRRIAPFLFYDKDPYLVLGEDGKLYYLLDAYTVSDKYPYSQAFDTQNNFNYIRNSVKITMDAYSGEVNFYVFDAGDPIIKAYQKIYPTLFKTANDFPSDLKQHARYAEEYFNIQSMMMRDYHMSNPTVFYNREDRWELSQVSVDDKKTAQDAYFSIIRLPGETSPEFILMRSYSPSGKQNMVAWLAARSDGDDYGKLLLYKFPKGVQIPGTLQVDALINQDPTISAQLTLWGQGGNRVVRGNLLVYPISGSLLYVEPLYLESAQNKYPQLKKIFVYYKDKIVMEDSLDKALNSLFGGSHQQIPLGQAQPPASAGPTALGGAAGAEREQLLQRLLTAFRESQEKMKAGDWAGYGQLQKEMDEIAKSLEGSR